MNTRGSLVLFVALASGCAIPPKTPGELRSGHEKESTEVNRPYQAVARDVARAAEKCLSKAVDYQRKTRDYTASIVHAYKPTVVVGKRKTELQLQVSITYNKSVEPPGGFYYLLSEISPLSPGKTKVDIYRVRGEQELVAKSIKSWANGRTGCPDLTRN